MLFSVATIALALLASSNSVLAKRDLQVKRVDSDLEKVKDLNIVTMDCEGEAAARTKKCVRADGVFWGCEGELVCVLKNHKSGKCIGMDENIPAGDAWREKNKGVLCGSRSKESKMVAGKGKTTPPDEGNSCPASDVAGGKCECAGHKWRCGDACNMIAKSCDEGLQCFRKWNNRYAICATFQDFVDRGNDKDYDPKPVPCGENIGTWSVPAGKEAIPGPMTGIHADRCAAEKAKHKEHGHDGGNHKRKLFSRYFSAKNLPMDEDDSLWL